MYQSSVFALYIRDFCRKKENVWLCKYLPSISVITVAEVDRKLLQTMFINI